MLQSVYPFSGPQCYGDGDAGGADGEGGEGGAVPLRLHRLRLRRHRPAVS